MNGSGQLFAFYHLDTNSHKAAPSRDTVAGQAVKGGSGALTYQEGSSLEHVGGVHDALQDQGLQLLRVHLLGVQGDAVEQRHRQRAQPTLLVELGAGLERRRCSFSQGLLSPAKQSWSNIP